MATNLLRPTQEQLAEAVLDITYPARGVEVQISIDGTVLWANVDGVCVLRVLCRMPSIVVEDNRVGAS